MVPPLPQWHGRCSAPAGGLGLVTTGAIKPNNAQRKAISWITQSELHQPTMNTFLVARKSDNWSTATDMFPLQAVASSLLAAVSGYGYYGLPYAGHVGHIVGSAENGLIGEVEQSRRRPLLGSSPGWKRLLCNYHKGRAALRHYANQPARPFWLLCRGPNFTLRDRWVNARLA